MIIELGQNKRIEIDDKIAQEFERVVMVSLKEYAPAYLQMEYGKELNDVLNTYSDTELKKVIMKYAEHELFLIKGE